MTIWHHEEQYGGDRETAYVETCLYCQTPLERDREDEQKIEFHEFMNWGMSDKFTTTAQAVIGICPACGWWKYGLGTSVGGRRPVSYQIKMGSLRRLDLSDITIPLAEARKYLMARFESRYDIHPRLFEDVVGSVFADHGYKARVTAYSGDGGIDVILDAGGSTVGVQVKRYKEKIGVDQIRELTGALVIGGHTRGIFVTTSEFQAGAAATASASGARGYPIELINARRFYEALKIAQLSGTRDVSNLKPWSSVPEYRG
jgi:restriction system protein